MMQYQLCLLLLLMGLYSSVIQCNGASVTTLSDEQMQRQLIEDFIKNQLSSGKCSDFVAGIILVDKPFDELCSTLTLNSNLIESSDVGCSDEDYRGLKTLICEYSPPAKPSAYPAPSSPPPTTTTTPKAAPAPAPSSSSNQAQNNPALNSEQAQRGQIKQVMEHEISDICRGRVEGIVSDDKPLDQACQTLGLIESAVKTQGCTQQEYNKLHEVICNYVSSPDSESTAKPPTTPKPTPSSSTPASPTTASAATTPSPSPTTTTTSPATTPPATASSTTTTTTTTTAPTPKQTPSSSTTTPKATTAPTTNSQSTPNQGQTSTDITTAKQVTDQELDDPTIQSTGASVSATLSNDQTPGHSLKEIIENLITDGGCTTSIEQLALDCSTLTGNRAAILTFCSLEGYNKLHAALCNNTPTPNPVKSSSPSSTPTTTLKTSTTTTTLKTYTTTTTSKTTAAAPGTSAPNQGQNTPAPNSEQAQRDKIKEVIENELSSDRCKTLVAAQFSDDTPLDAACKQLEGFKTVITVVGCTQDDYDKLHAVICDYVGSSDSKSTVKPPITTASPTNQGGPANDDKQRDVIKCVIENELSSEGCKAAVELQVDENMDLQAGCTLLESLHPAVSDVGCTEDDYTKLHQAICDYGKTCNGAKVKGFNVKKWQDYVLSVIDNQLTQQCATLPRSQATEDATPEEACKMFELGRSALKDMCKENELQLLNEALCEYKDKTDKRILDETKVVIDTKLTPSCKTAISRQADAFSSNVSQSCTIVSEAGPGLIDNQQCTQADIDSLNNTVCYGDSSCDPPTGVCYSGEEIVKLSPRESRVRTVIGKLTGQCKSVMATGISQLSQEPEDACQTLEATRRNLIDGNVCTELDFVKLKQVVCMDVPLGTDVGTEDEIRDNALSIMQNDLTKSCHDLVWPQAAQFAGSLVKGCDLLQMAGATLVGKGLCTQEDYDKLEDAVCSAGKPAPVYNEKERAQREHIEDVITHNVAEKCRTTMLPQIEAQRDKPLPESCEKLNKNKNVIVTGGVCSDDDFGKIQKAVCGSAATTTASYLALGFCLLLRLL